MFSRITGLAPLSIPRCCPGPCARTPCDGKLAKPACNKASAPLPNGGACRAQARLEWGGLCAPQPPYPAINQPPIDSPRPIHLPGKSGAIDHPPPPPSQTYRGVPRPFRGWRTPNYARPAGGQSNCPTPHCGTHEMGLTRHHAPATDPIRIRNEIDRSLRQTTTWVSRHGASTPRDLLLHAQMRNDNADSSLADPKCRPGHCKSEAFGRGARGSRDGCARPMSEFDADAESTSSPRPLRPNTNRIARPHNNSSQPTAVAQRASLARPRSQNKP